jgi:hypothetical protein
MTLRRFLALALSALVLVALWGALPLRVAASTTGSGLFSGTVILPGFPCANCGGGSFTGSAALTLAGVGTTALDGVPIPYSATWAAPVPPATNASASSFGYDEQCLGGQPDWAPPLIGTAGGFFTITGGTLVLATGSVGPATLSGTFSWLREGTAAHLSFTGLTISAPSTTAINLNDALLAGQGGAGFVWSTPTGTCGTQVTNEQATVAGIALQAA